MGDAGTGPLKVGKYGLVLADDKSDMPFKVRWQGRVGVDAW